MIVDWLGRVSMFGSGGRLMMEYPNVALISNVDGVKAAADLLPSVLSSPVNVVLVVRAPHGTVTSYGQGAQLS